MKRIFILFIFVFIAFIVSCAPSFIDNNIKLTLNIDDQNMIFEKETSIKIEWTYDGNLIKNVRLELFDNNQLEFLIKDSISVNEKVFYWEVPNSVEERKNYSLKIVDVDDSNVNDVLNISFVNKGYENYALDFGVISNNLGISSPNGGIFEAGKEKTIYWSTRNISFIKNVRIELYNDNNYYLTIVDKIAYDNEEETPKGGGGGGGTIGGSTLGKMIWNIPEYIDDTLNYRMVVRDYNNLNEYNVSNPFEIVKNGTKTFDIRDFYSSEVYIASYSYWISWNYTGDIKNVKLELLKDDVLFEVIEENLTVTEIYEGNPSFAYYDWSIDETIEENDKYSVRISEVGNPSNYDTTLDFEILDADTKIINVLPIGSPNTIGSLIFVHWDFIGDIDYVKVELTKNDIVYYTINDNYQVNLLNIYGSEQETTNNTGGLDWTIPDTIEEGNDYKIRVTYLNDDNVFGETSVFSILSNN